MSEINLINYDDLFNPDSVNKAYEEAKNMFKDNNSGFEKDESVYFPSGGKNGEPNFITVRLLPSQYSSPYTDTNGQAKKLDILEVKKHKFEEGTESIKCNCLKMLNDLEGTKNECPVCDINPWQGKREVNPEGYAEWKRKSAKKSGWVNVLIENDTLNPTMNGQVKKMYLNGYLLPIIKDYVNGLVIDGKPVPGQEGKNPFDLLGNPCIFNIIVQKDGEFMSYKKSNFSNAGVLFNGDKGKIIEKIKESHDLSKSIGKMYTYEELQQKLDKMYGTNEAEVKKETEKFNDEIANAFKKNEEVEKEEAKEELIIPTTKPEPVPVATPAPAPAPKVEESVDVDFESYFGGK
jgi:hypothetical protein